MFLPLRLVPGKVCQKSPITKILGNELKALSTVAQTKVQIDENADQQTTEPLDSTAVTNYRFIYPEFLPDPNPLHRNSMREKLERIDMLARRSVLSVPEFYVGSILAVTYSEAHAVGKVNRFVGICILREGCGLRAAFTLRNVVNGEPVEVRYDLYDPVIQKIDCLRLEKRLDDELLYLRDAPLEYSTFPLDMEAELTKPGTVPLNEIKIPLNPRPWLERWERKDLKGVQNLNDLLNASRIKKAKLAAKPWEKYDLMKIYRSTIPEEEQIDIFSDLHTELRHLEIQKNILKRRQVLDQQKKNV
ncbi:39S ribosomal protein L19, mitochondrial [Ceratina calcarata]|uniref:Large ribosomal subunit protein bL19m n=1 Tax=Ceratina calcarata TaxID=156304 RepID=A0AAJ7N479_9HYME|nr:39S ribosomal protein L19, mitochondrial [Ceratina calcarata]